MNPIPSAETIGGYEKLGIIGILLLVLCVGLVVIVYSVRQVKIIADQFFQFVTHLTKAQTEQAAAFDQQQEISTRLHERLDNLMSCTRSGCPVFIMRKQQQKDAVRFTDSQNPTQQPT